MAKLLPPERQRYGSELVGLDKERQVATFADGRQVRYRALSCEDCGRDVA